MFGYCIWLETPSLQFYVNYYSYRNCGEHFMPHISIATHRTMEEAITLHGEIPYLSPQCLTLGLPYQSQTENFYSIQCDIIECPDHHVSIAYRYDYPWTPEEISACRPPPTVTTGMLSVWKCDGLVSAWVKKHDVPTP
jgi:hypothetical protein